ncbi:hypothetical protein OMP38_11955 [Cohnella ginsengisoli]|uniref:Uncharacterized protein n=1 Tax=Cohnella ginsengisoli TaxID=425004 RepID=A0A9X4KGG4_9BACL|nr:hypothetical protein [Cohnella ginsengisoli]MDG0791501.1 hypothetical protein [Cohnella ginsengisoli]
MQSDALEAQHHASAIPQATADSDRQADMLSGGQPVTLKVDLRMFTPTTDAARTKTNPEKRGGGSDHRGQVHEAVSERDDRMGARLE